MKSHKPPAPLAMDLLIREILFAYFRLSAAGERMFASSGLTPGKVSLMRSIMEEGTQSVSQIARARPVARQAVQRMADELKAAGMLEYVENPTHRRAKLARLTRAGEKALRRMLALELRWAQRLARNFDQREIETSRAVIQRLMKLLISS